MTPADLAVVTPAHNEAELLEKLGRTVAAQTSRPVLWVIANDASTDETGAVADRLAAEHGFVRVLHRSRTKGRQLSSKADAIAEAYEVVQQSGIDVSFVASLDADLELPEDTFERILKNFDADERLGISGGIYEHLVGGTWEYGRISPTHVPGPLQVFRREVFEAVGGYLPLRDGGLDVVSTAQARMLGWETGVTPGVVYVHNRQTGTGGGRHPLVAAYVTGIRDRSLGMSLRFQLAKCVYRLKSGRDLAPLAALVGFLQAMITRRPSDVPDDVAAFIRNEQHQRLSGQMAARLGAARPLRYLRS